MSTASGPGDDRIAPKRSRPRVLAVTVAAISLFVWLLASGFTHDPRAVPDVLIGRHAPDFTLRQIQTAGTVHLADLRGQVVVLNFWASWCDACVLEQGSLESAWNRYADDGVVFLGPLFQDTAGGARGYAATYGVGWPLLEDPGGRVAIAYGVSGVPETVVVDAQGSIAFKQVGPVTYDLLAGWIQRLLPVMPSAASP